MSDLSTTSCYKENRSDCGNNSMFMILMLLLLCGGDNGIFGGCGGNNGCGNNGCCSNNGLDGILPIILMLSLSGGSF